MRAGIAILQATSGSPEAPHEAVEVAEAAYECAPDWLQAHVDERRRDLVARGVRASQAP